ncbi:hypothetical protein [Senegalia massiliensis]|uniref:hypothetical protein n=1 Tax=Senegalia massiliensis TaxID=1720316 RepID=UPI0013EEEC1B|nr:hypothetical protein [Senegalia massiliensis]
MKKIKEFLLDNLIEIILLIGIINISIGFFMFNKVAGFIATGSLFIALAFLMWRGGD